MSPPRPPGEYSDNVVLCAFRCLKCGAIRPYGRTSDFGLSYFPKLRCEGGHVAPHVLWVKEMEFEMRYRLPDYWSSGNDARISHVVFIPKTEGEPLFTPKVAGDRLA